MRRNTVLLDGLAVCVVAIGLSVAGWAFTHPSTGASSCQNFSQLRAGDGHSHVDTSSLARAQSVTLSPVASGGLQVSWQFDQEVPNLGQETVGELVVDIRQDSRLLVLVVPTVGNIAWAEMGQGVNIAKAQQQPYEVLVTYSPAEVFDLAGSFLWNASVDYGEIYGLRSSCPSPGSLGVKAG